MEEDAAGARSALRDTVADAEEGRRRGIPAGAGRLRQTAKIWRGVDRMFDLIVTGGKGVMRSGSAEPADIGVSGGKIAAVGAPGSLADTGAARIVDAAGQIVMPGGGDPHIHCSSPVPFPGRNEDLLIAPPEQVSRAAPPGGTTPLLDFAPCPADQPLQQSIELRRREWAGACYCDYGLQLLLHGQFSRGVLDPV